VILHVNAIANRMSLRQPQRESLAILDRVCEIVNFQKEHRHGRRVADDSFGVSPGGRL